MSLKINTCENLWSNFSANLIVVALLEQNQFEWPNLSIYFNFLCAVPRGDVTKKTRFLMSHLLSFQHGWYIPHAAGNDVCQVTGMVVYPSYWRNWCSSGCRNGGISLMLKELMFIRLTSLKSAGIVDYVINSYMSNATACLAPPGKDSSVNDIHAYDIRDFGGIFLILLCGQQSILWHIEVHNFWWFVLIRSSKYLHSQFN